MADFSPQKRNRIARAIITSGGLGLIGAVLAILVFIAREAAPLFGRAHATAARLAGPAATGRALAGGVDDDGVFGFEIGPRATVFFRLSDGDTIATKPHPFGTAIATAADVDARRGLVALGSADGRAAVGTLAFDVQWQGTERRVVPILHWYGVAVVDSLHRAVEHVAADRDDDGQLAFVAGLGAHATRCVIVTPDGGAPRAFDLDDRLSQSDVGSVLVSFRAALLAVGTADGTLCLWQLRDGSRPEFEDHVRAAPAGITALRLLLGDQTLVVGSAQGRVSTWLRQRYVSAKNEGASAVTFEGRMLLPGEVATLPDRDYGRRFGHLRSLRFRTSGNPWTRIHDFSPHAAAIVSVAAAPRGRTFATLDAGGGIRLQHATTARTLLAVRSGGTSQRALLFAPQGRRLSVVADAAALQAWTVFNPHPEASLAALVEPTWYEGYAEPRAVWQSTGGSDDFEPKLSLVPLIWGTLKGTFYALLFSIPIAVAAALYLSQLAAPGLRVVVKPVIELMAAMPSVVVGFLAALWLAPLLEGHIGRALGAVLVAPLGLAAAIAAWFALPRGVRQAARPGSELVVTLIFVAAAAWLGTALGAPLEAHAFGGDLKQWLFDHHGITYDQRNCLVIGIALGFAVIPIIFTISEDAMTAVPPSMTTASLALGASRWQSALHIVLPAASPGVFAAIMLGLGRAIGETMIVLMATGNTPILDFSPFNGMRTMAAGIAVEIPEAPHGGTLYRILFLTGFLLFAFTFVLNSLADLVGRRLRRRYGQF